MRYSSRSHHTSRISQRASANASKLSLDKVLKKHRLGKRSAAPDKDELKEQDPIADKLSNPSDLPDNKSDHSDNYEEKTLPKEELKRKKASSKFRNMQFQGEERM